MFKSFIYLFILYYFIFHANSNHHSPSSLSPTPARNFSLLFPEGGLFGLRSAYQADYHLFNVYGV